MILLSRRAVWCVLSQVAFDNDGTGDKARWKEDARLKLHNAIDKVAAGTLSASGIRHGAYKNALPLFDPDANPSEPEHTKSTAFARSYDTPAPRRIERRTTVAASTAVQIQREDRSHGTVSIAKHPPKDALAKAVPSVIDELRAKQRKRRTPNSCPQNSS